MGTPYQLNNLLNRTAVDVNPGEYYDDCRGSLLVVLCSHIIAVAKANTSTFSRDITDINFVTYKCIIEFPRKTCSFSTIVQRT